MTDPTPTSIAGAINLKQRLEAEALATQSWFSKHPRAIFALIGLLLGIAVGHFV